MVAMSYFLIEILTSFLPYERLDLNKCISFSDPL